MNVSLRWLEAFFRQPLDPADVATRLALLGAPADAVEPLHAELQDIVVARVHNVQPHPNADRLRVCEVDDGGDGFRHVVCGATNVQAGSLYAYARAGTTLPGGLKLERRKIRGEVSEGMLCSERELGLGQQHEGIWEVQTDAAPGTPLLAAIELADVRLVLDITPNRPDLLGHKGVARELAASLNTPFRLPVLPGVEGVTVPPSSRHGATANVGGVEVRIDDPSGCARFRAAVVRGVVVGPSPEWLKRRLESVGVRSINNVVDATNYAMFEHGQPMHPYDLNTLAGPAIVATAAAGGQSLATLDGVERVIPAGAVVIADADSAIGIGGVMGGAATEVTASTTDILLECAWFAPSRIRAARRALGLSTEASHRFERGVDLWGSEEPFRRCLALILTMAGGALDGTPVDLWPEVTHPPRIFLRLSRVAQVLGVELALRDVERHLVAIGATCVAKPEDGRVAVDVPGWRPDLISEIDLIEEVARMHGYDAFPDDLRGFRVGPTPDAPLWTSSNRLRQFMTRLGLQEVVTLPLTGEHETHTVRLRNPLSEAEGSLRSSLLPSLARQAERNWAASERDIRLFELGAVFRRSKGGTLAEPWHVAAVISGGRSPGHWSGASADVDEWDLKAMFEDVIRAAYPGAAVHAVDDGWEARTVDGAMVGEARELQADRPPWAARLFGLEVLMQPELPANQQFVPLPVTPSSERDVTLEVPDGVTAEMVLHHLSGAGVTVLESVAVVNEYRGSRVQEGQRSVTLRFTFRAPDRTLESREIDKAERRLLEALEAGTGVRRRDQ